MLEALQISTEINLALAEILLERYGKSRAQHRRRGRLRAADLEPPTRRSACCTRRSPPPATAARFRYGLDCAATHYYDADAAPTCSPASSRDTESMIELLPGPDPRLRHRHDRGPARRGGLRRLRRADPDGCGIQIVGDDLFVTNPAPARARIAAERGELAALEGQPDRHADRGARRRRDRPPRGLHASSSRSARARPRTRSSPTSPSPSTRARSRPEPRSAASEPPSTTG